MITLLAFGPGAAGALAQDTTRTAPADSLALEERLRQAEEAIELLRQQLGMQAEAGVSTASRFALELSGRVLMNAFSNTRRVNNADVPSVVLPDVAGGPRSGGAGATIRQTSLGIAVTADDVLGGTVLGDLDLDFYGGQLGTGGGRTFPLLRVRTARIILRRPGLELLAGQETPLISDLNPVSLATLGSPGFAAAGNLWFWIPQLRATFEIPGPVRLGIQGAVLSPMTGDAVGTFETDVDPGERSRRPSLQARLRARWGEDAETGGEIGCGVHKGWLSLAGDTLHSTDAVACDYRIPFWRLELRGELYDGQALRGLGGGGIGQNLTSTGRPVEDRGGWTQLNFRVSPAIMTGAGCGASDPDDSDLPATGRLRNAACAAHLSVRPGGPIVVGAEYRRIETKYATGSFTNDHLNLAFGLEY